MLNSMVMFICPVLDQEYNFENSKLAISQHCVWLSQNETCVTKADRHFKNAKYFCFTLQIAGEV